MGTATSTESQRSGSRTQLTDDEVRFFNDFGFVLLRHQFTGHEMATVEAEFERRAEEQLKGSEFDGSIEKGVHFTGSGTPFLKSLPDSPRFYGIAQQLFGDDVIGAHCHGNFKVGDTRWHSDSRYPEHRFGAKFGFYLEAVDGDSGSLRVIPGSHQQPMHDKVKRFPGIDDPAKVRDFPGFVWKSDPGDVIVFNLAIWHASYGGRVGRPMFDVVYYAHPKSPAHEESLRDQYMRSRKGSVRWALERNEEPAYPIPEWHLSPGESPIRDRWIDTMRRFGYFDLDNEAYLKELLSQKEGSN